MPVQKAFSQEGHPVLRHVISAGVIIVGGVFALGQLYSQLEAQGDLTVQNKKAIKIVQAEIREDLKETDDRLDNIELNQALIKEQLDNEIEDQEEFRAETKETLKEIQQLLQTPNNNFGGSR